MLGISEHTVIRDKGVAQAQLSAPGGAEGVAQAQLTPAEKDAFQSRGSPPTHFRGVDPGTQ